MKDVREVCERVNHLQTINAAQKNEQRRIRDIMDGGPAGLRALAGRAASRDLDVLDSLPTGNPLLSGLTHLSQKLQQVPDLKVPAPPLQDSSAAKKHAERRERIVRSLDEACVIDRQMPQVGMWLPGYGFAVWVLVERRDVDGQPYPHAELRDPMEAYPGDWGVDQQPADIAFTRNIPVGTLVKMYPEHARSLLAHVRGPGGALLLSNTPANADASSWSTLSQGIQIAEYYDNDGCRWVVPDRNILLEYKPNPLRGRPQFEIVKRFSFNKLQGQYDHVIGLMAMTARLTVMQAQFIQDSVHTEALALDTPIPTPTGWTTMGAIEQGDLILGADGLPVEVIKATPVQDDRVTYRVTFEDGTSVVASDGHLWETKVVSTRMAPKVRTTQEMVDDGRRFRVPASKPWKLPEATDLRIDPYMLGLWLGDGSSNASIVTIGAQDWDEQVDRIQGLGYTTTTVATQPDRCGQVYVSERGAKKGRRGLGLLLRLRQEDVLDNKHVPAKYLRGSVDQRLALLRGLMDSDGNIGNNRQCRFASTNARLADGMLELLRSLGEVPVKRWVEDDRNRGGGIYEVTFTPRRFNPFTLTRKAERVRFHRRGPEWVTIRSIERVDTVPVRCIAVASDDHLFLAGEGAHVTHNTNIFGQAPAGGYRKGRFSINEFDPGTRVEKPMNNMPFQVFQAIDRLERQLRVTARYPVTDDAQSPNSFVTGAGLEELGSTMGLEVREYQTVLRLAIESLDSKRLEWMDRSYPNAKRALIGEYRGEPYAETYKPGTAIAGNYRTRRKYGFMAGWDESRKLVGGLQLVAGEIISKETMRDNLDGLDEAPTVVTDQIRAEKAEAVAMDTLLQMAQSGDPRALAAAIDMLPASPTKAALEKFFIPEEEEAPVEEEAALPEQPPSLEEAMSMMAGGGENSSLARMTAQGNVGGGVQVQGAF